MRAREILEINAPDELQVDPELIQRFTDRGYQIDGEGQDQVVMSRPGSDSVIKIVGAGSVPRQNAVRRYVDFFRRNQRNPHFPRVTPIRDIVWNGERYAVYSQERLYHLSGDEDILDYLEDTMGALARDESPNLDRLPPGLTAQQVEGLVAAVDAMFRAGLVDTHSLDLSNVYNIMQRANSDVLVIVDPLSDLDSPKFVTEQSYVTRIDSKPISDFSQGMQTYYHTADFSKSGQFDKDTPVPKEYTGKMTGVYAGDPTFTALYATGNANQTRYVAQYGPGQPIVYFDRKDVPAMRSRRTYLTVFDASRFRKLPTGEYFSSDPGQFIKQEEIKDPFQYIKNQGWEFRIVDDLQAVLKKLQQQNKKDPSVRYGAEGMGLEENFADGRIKGKSRPGRVKRAGASCKGSVTDLRARAKKYGGERGKMYHWCANMKGGKK